MDQVAEVKSKTDIVAIINEHVPLTKAGQNYKANCPFHNEKTPSFVVSPELQIYKCFGCGESGDVFTFLEKFEGMEFSEALSALAERAGVILKKINSQGRTEKDKLIEINEKAVELYHYLLVKHGSGNSARKYLDERKITPESIKEFRLGFAPDKPDLLFNFLSQKKGEDPRLIEQSGLVVNVRGKYIDRFRGRVIFPICDPRGNTIALAGRIMPGKEKLAKYINSPETPVYHKSNVLFGLNLSKQAIKRSQMVIVVEGEMDFISVWQAGIKNVVAIKGSAFTMEQIKLLSRFTKTIILALDSDFAGNNAAVKSISLAQKEGLEVRVVDLGKYKDPDDYARADPDGFSLAVRESETIWDFLINFIFSKHDPLAGSGKAKISSEVVPILASIEDKIVQAHYAQIVAGKLGVPIESVSEQIGSSPVLPHSSKPEGVVKTKFKRELLEDELFSLCFKANPKLLIKKGMIGIIETPVLKKIQTSLTEYFKSNLKFSASEFAKALPRELSEKYEGLIMAEVGEGNIDREVQRTLSTLKELVIKNRLSDVFQKISRFEKSSDQNALKSAKEEFVKVSQDLSSLRASEIHPKI